MFSKRRGVRGGRHCSPGFSLRPTAVCLSAGFLIGAARNPNLFRFPVAAWEDGTLGIGLYSNPDAPLFHFQVGYIHAVPDMIFWATMRILPMLWAPYALAWIALLITACVPWAAYGLFRNAYALSAPAATCGAVIVAILPLDDWLLISNIDYSIWHLAVILFLCLWNPVPSAPLRWAFHVTWRALIVASNPLCLPAALVWAALAVTIKRPAARAAYGLLAGLAALYAVFGIEHRHVGATAAMASLGHIAAMALRVSVQGGLLDLLPGSILLGGLPSAWLCTLLVAVSVAVLGMIFAARRRATGQARRAALEIAVLAGALACAGLICAVGRGMDNGPAFLLDGSRFTYVPRVLWCCGITAALIQVWTAGAGHAGRRVFLAGGVAALAAMMLLGRASAYEGNDPAASARLGAFLARAATARANGAPGPFRLDRVDRYGDWSIVLFGDQRKGWVGRAVPPGPPVDDGASLK